MTNFTPNKFELLITFVGARSTDYEVQEWIQNAIESGRPEGTTLTDDEEDKPARRRLQPSSSAHAESGRDVPGADIPTTFNESIPEGIGASS